MAHVEIYDGYDMGSFDENDLAGSSIVHLDSSLVIWSWAAGRYGLDIEGQGLTYGGPNGALLTGGVVTGARLAASVGRMFVSGAHADAALLGAAYTAHDSRISEAALLNGDDDIHVVDNAPPTSTPNPDHTYLIYAYAGNDLVVGGGERSTIFGGVGNDTIQASSGTGNYLRGDEGGDSLVGASGFDDINGNTGDDTGVGGDGDDWVVGGKDNDLLFGDNGGDLVYGNLGADTLDGGAGADIVRGGQGDDVVSGGDGDDFVSGDLGNDVMSGGAGADTFHSFAAAGIDRVVDFRLSEGDHIRLDPGTTYALNQVGGDTVLDMGGGNQMILVGVSLLSIVAAGPGTIIVG